MFQRLCWWLRGRQERRLDLGRRRRFADNVRAILKGLGCSATMRYVARERGHHGRE